MQGYRRVAIVEEFYHILKQIHDKDCLHAGSRKTYARVSSYFHAIEVVSYPDPNVRNDDHRLQYDITYRGT